jgi:hypothetical protein
MGSTEFLRQKTCTEYPRQNTNTECTDKTNEWYLRQRRQMQSARDTRDERRVSQKMNATYTIQKMYILYVECQMQSKVLPICVLGTLLVCLRSWVLFFHMSWVSALVYSLYFCLLSWVLWVHFFCLLCSHNTEDVHFVRRVPNAVQSILTNVEDEFRLCKK